MNNLPLSNEQYFIEYNLGLLLAPFLGIPVDNRTPHRLTPMKSYAFIWKFIKGNKISGEDLIKGKVKTIYEKIIFDRNKFGRFGKWSRLHFDVLPNYIKCQNFQLSIVF